VGIAGAASAEGDGDGATTAVGPGGVGVAAGVDVGTVAPQLPATTDRKIMTMTRA
jgi:hypothetical protein